MSKPGEHPFVWGPGLPAIQVKCMSFKKCAKWDKKSLLSNEQNIFSLNGLAQLKYSGL